MSNNEESIAPGSTWFIYDNTYENRLIRVVEDIIFLDEKLREYEGSLTNEEKNIVAQEKTKKDNWLFEHCVKI